MRRFHLLLPLLLIAALLAGGGFATTALGAEATHDAPAAEEHHLPLKATLLYYGIGGHPPTDPAHPETAKIQVTMMRNYFLMRIVMNHLFIFGHRINKEQLKGWYEY